MWPFTGVFFSYCGIKSKQTYICHTCLQTQGKVGLNRRVIIKLQPCGATWCHRGGLQGQMMCLMKFPSLLILETSPWGIKTIHLRNNLSLQLQKRRWSSDGMELRVRGWDLNTDSGVTFIWENVGNITDLLLCAPSTSHHNHSSLHHSTSILSLSKLDGS